MILKMRLTIVGAGFVGLVTAAVLADFKNEVWVVDYDDEKIKNLSSGKIPFYEPGLEKLILKNFKSGQLRFTTSYHQAIPQSEIVFICVGTPNKNGQIDLTFVKAAAKSVAENLKNQAIVVIKSTVPPGMNKQIEKLMKRYTRTNFDLASVPEFLREGKAIEDTLNPYRVIIGAEKKSVIDKLLKLHQLLPGERLVCDATSAQMIKYGSNCFLATKISFTNSMSVLCDLFGANIELVTKGMGLDRRIGPDFLKAGLGYGGSCFPKDVQALIHLAEQKHYNFQILKAVQTVNKKQIDYFVGQVAKSSDGSLKNKVLVVLGLSFKPETSDMREARSIYLIEELKKKGAEIRACDPIAITEAKKIISGVKFFTNPYEALKGAEALLLVTEWKEYQKLDFKKIKKLMKKPVVVDGRNLYNKKELISLGFLYKGIGQ